ncbi:MAG: N-acetylmuramoyl-L-alanine amidase [Firmicutes bacterium]|nr:N-acetylmuramoyl-L-alanine amidase [Bacillota bacterium]
MLSVVIDPGHGGTNHGANYNGWHEEDITLITSLAMKERLEDFNNVKVYITREDDVSLSLEERAAFAHNADADILISLHYNASEKHDLYGTEVWVPSSGINYTLAKGLGECLIKKYTDKGYYDRCVKTKIGESEKDYYGIIRNAAEYSIPSIIMEHCFIDNSIDENTLDMEKIKQFGVWDAEAVAEYYDLPPKTTPKHPYKPIPDIITDPSYNNEIIYDDRTEPTDVKLNIISTDSNGNAEIELSAHDSESKLIYYSYSTNGGIDWTDLKKWSSGEHCIFTVDLSGCNTLCARAYNCFDLFTECSIPVKSNTEKMYVLSDFDLSTESSSTTFQDDLHSHPEIQIQHDFTSTHQYETKTTPKTDYNPRKNHTLILIGICLILFFLLSIIIISHDKR